MLNIDAQQPVKAHPLIRDPRQEEKCDRISTPVVKKQLIPGQKDDKQGDPMAEAVLARPYVKKFPNEYIRGRLAFSSRKFARLLKDRFLRDCPRY
jgi:hypothetical protein